jgi:hypothetical protein
VAAKTVCTVIMDLGLVYSHDFFGPKPADNGILKGSMAPRAMADITESNSTIPLFVTTPLVLLGIKREGFVTKITP